MKKFTKVIFTICFSFLILVCGHDLVYAEAGTEENIITSVTKQGITFSIEYPQNIKCGIPTSFKMTAVGGSGSYKYRVHSILWEDNSNRVMVYDVSQGNNGAYSVNDTFNFTFYCSGTYYLRFGVMDTATNVFINSGLNDMKLEIADPDYPSVEEIVDSVTRECASQCSTEFEKAVWLNDWIVDHCKYDSSGTYCAEEGALARGLATCQGYHGAYVKLLNKMGIETGNMTGNGHIWTAAKLDGKWYQIDTTWNDPGYEMPSTGSLPDYDLKHLYFGLTDEIIKTEHSEHTVHDEYMSNSLEDNYFIKTGKIDEWTSLHIEDIQTHLDKKESSFYINISGVYYSNILYNLVAYDINHRTWKSNGETIKLTATYTFDSSDKRNGVLKFNVSYSEKTIKSAWVRDNSGRWYYYDANGNKSVGWKYIGGKWYYMNGNGVMTTGWQYVGGRWYYMNGSGAMTTGWQYIGGRWYYMNGSGAMTTGWQYVGGRWYYMNGSGAMTTGWQYIGGRWYYMNGSGAMTTGWQYVGGCWYYMNGSGAMTTGWQYVGGRWYYMNGSGVWVR